MVQARKVPKVGNGTDKREFLRPDPEAVKLPEAPGGQRRPALARCWGFLRGVHLRFLRVSKRGGGVLRGF